MKVAMWASSETRCGIATYTAALVDALRPCEIEVDLVPVPYTDRDPEGMERTLARLNAADLVHIQHEYTFFGGVAPGASSLPRYLRGLQRPYVITAHTVFTAAELLRLPQETRWRQRMAKRLLATLPSYRASVERGPFARAAAVIVHTAAAKARMRERRIPESRLHVIPAGSPPPAATPTAEEIQAFRDHYKLGGGKVATIFGYVTPEKGYETALEALRSLPPAVKLVIAGGARVEREAPYVDQLREDIRKRGLAGRVVITGYLEDPEVAVAMAASDLVLVPHLAANGSYSVMIALSYGKPVLASDLACFREISEQGGGVELFAPGDERSLADRMGFLLASAATRKDMALASQSLAATRTWGAVAERTASIYRNALG
jgi:glycosyltransferase involved in cell wall biosynthesis